MAIDDSLRQDALPRVSNYGRSNISPRPQIPGVVLARPHAISALKPKDALEQNEFARPCGTVSEKPPPGTCRVEIDFQKERNNAIARPRQPQGLFDEFFGRFALDAVGRIANDGLGALRDIGRPGLVIEKIDAVLEVGGDNTKACANEHIGLSTHVLNGAFHSLPYDGLNDFTPISAIGGTPFVLYARKTMLAKDLNEFIGWLKANPNKASAAFTVGSGHLITALFQKETGTQFSLVPYRALPYQDLMAGQIDFSFLTPNQLPLVRAGSIKAYAVSGDMRLALAPDIPTLVEMGLPISFSSWGAFFAPKGPPREIIGKLNAVVVEALADPAVRARLADLGADVFPREQQTPEALAALMRVDAEKWLPLIKEFGIKAE